jgi:hypothetical protein
MNHVDVIVTMRTSNPNPAPMISFFRMEWARTE